MGLAFVPYYIKYLGIEAYGLIGIFALLQAWLALIDMGLKPALGREMARFSAGAHDAQSIRDLLRSVELIGLAIGTAIATGVWASSGWLATHWVTSKTLRPETVAAAFAVMGLVTALRFVEDIYVSTLVGLQRQALQNSITGAISTLRGLGAVGILAWVSPDIGTFFAWQAIVSLTSMSLFALSAYRVLPSVPKRPRFSKSALLGVWQFAAGMMAITGLSLLLTQVDKILLARLLTLEAFAYYALAGVVVNGLYTLTGPITGAFYPRFTQLATKGDEPGLCSLYHLGAQSVSVLTGSAAIVLMVFGERVLTLWTKNPALAARVAPLVAVMALGTLLNGLMVIPYQLQLAHGWTSLTLQVNCAAVVLLVPAIWLVVPIFGAIGAAWVWVILNVGYVIFEIALMHRRLLPKEKWRWYREDVGGPLAAALVSGFIFRRLIPSQPARPTEFLALLACATCVLAAAGLAAPAVRSRLRIR